VHSIATATEVWKPRNTNFDAGDLAEARNKANALAGPDASYSGPRYTGDPSVLTDSWISELFKLHDENKLLPIKDATLMVLDWIDVLGKETLEPFFEGISAGGEEREEGLQVGDTFLEIEGYLMFHRGGYHETAGGLYVLSPTKLSGFREPLPTPSPESPGSPESTESDSGSALTVVIVVAVLAAGVIGGVLWGAYNHRTVKQGVATATGAEANPYEESIRNNEAVDL